LAEEAKAVFTDVTARVLDAMRRGRQGEAARWLADLMYYANLRGMGDAYLRLLDRMLGEAEAGPPSLARRLAEALDSRLERMREGGEAALLGGLIAEAERVKEGRLGRHLAPPEALMREARRIVEEVLRG
jgi:hypothetical protein